MHTPLLGWTSGWFAYRSLGQCSKWRNTDVTQLCNWRLRLPRHIHYWPINQNTSLDENLVSDHLPITLDLLGQTTAASRSHKMDRWNTRGVKWCMSSVAVEGTARIFLANLDPARAWNPIKFQACFPYSAAFYEPLIRNDQTLLTNTGQCICLVLCSCEPPQAR